MTYATRASLADRYGEAEISQRESVLPAGAVDKALSDADAEIDAYVAARYATPLATVSSYVVRIAVAIARYHLLGESASELARKEYEDARAFLRDVQNGKAHLSASPLLAESPASGGAVVVSPPRVFSRGAL